MGKKWNPIALEFAWMYSNPNKQKTVKINGSDVSSERQRPEAKDEAKRRKRKTKGKGGASYFHVTVGYILG